MRTQFVREAARRAIYHRLLKASWDKKRDGDVRECAGKGVSLGVKVPGRRCSRTANVSKRNRSTH